MDYNNFYNTYPSSDDQNSFICPMAQNYYNYCEQMNRAMGDRLQEDLNYENTLDNDKRTPRDVERVVRMIEKDAKNEIKELERIGINPRLLNYLITSMVSYIDRNYNRYKGPFEQRVRAVEQDLRRDLYWVFDIFRVMSASPATVARLTDTVIRTSLKNLRPLPPAPPIPPPPVPMPRY